MKMSMKDLIGKRVSGLGTCGQAKGKTITGELYEYKFGYVIEDEFNKNIPCAVDKTTVILLEEINKMKDLITKDFNLEEFKEYVNTYTKSDACNSSLTFIMDMIYGIGLAVDKEEYQWSDGYKKFIEVINEIEEK